MKRFYLLAIALLSTTVLITSCGDDNDDIACGEITYTQEISDEAQEYGSAASTYASDPTTENCENFREAASDYVDELERLEECVPEAREQEYESNLEDARQDLEDLEC